MADETMSRESSESSAAASDMTPPWGSIPTEKFLLRHWNLASSESPDEQRTRLVREYIKVGPNRQNDPSPPMEPTSAQITSILDPWRSDDLRDLVLENSQLKCVWLRTCYADATDEKHEEYFGQTDMHNAVDGDHRFLNDATLYDFGPSWQRIFDILPELLEPLGENWEFYHDVQREEKEAMAAYVENSPTKPPAQDELMSLRRRIMLAYVVNFIIIEDAAALADGNLLLAFIDAYGRVVIQQRVCAGDAEEFAGSWLMHSWVDTWADQEMENEEIGEDYQEGGAAWGLNKLAI